MRSRPSDEVPNCIEMTWQPGDIRASRVLGTTAMYRALAEEDGHVRVEVVRAPGLKPGRSLRLTAAAFEAMEPVVATAAEVDVELASVLARWAA